MTIIFMHMVDLRLVEEVDEIKDTVSLLTQQLNEAEVARANLLQAAFLTPDMKILVNVVFACSGVMKRCRLSLLTNSVLVCESNAGGWGGGSCGVSDSQPMSTAVYFTLEPK
jgi:hypothetical protein